MNELKEKLLKDFEEKFYEGKENCVMCKKHKLYATPTEILNFLSSAITTAYEAGKESNRIMYQRARDEARKEIFDWCEKRCELNIKFNGTDKWNTDLLDLIKMLTK